MNGWLLKKLNSFLSPERTLLRKACLALGLIFIGNSTKSTVVLNM